MMGDDIGGKIVELHGTVGAAGSSYYITVPREGSSMESKFYLYIANQPTEDKLPKAGEEAAVKAIVWKVKDHWELVTDAQHFTGE